MGKLIFESFKKYGDTGLVEFSFNYNGDSYKILPKYGVHGALDKLEQFMRFVKYIAPKMDDPNPWLYKVNPEHKFSRVFDVYKNGLKTEEDPGDSEPVPAPDIQPTVPVKPDAEQMEMTFTASLDDISDRLERLGCTKEAYELDVIANTLDRWMTNKANLFSDEIANQGIEADTAKTVLDIAENTGLIK